MGPGPARKIRRRARTPQRRAGKAPITVTTSASVLFESFFERAGLQYTSTNASLYLWVEVPEEYGGDDEAYAVRLLEEGIIVAPGSSFGPGGEGFFRVALVPKLEECGEAVGRWEDLAE